MKKILTAVSFLALATYLAASAFGSQFLIDSSQSSTNIVQSGLYPSSIQPSLTLTNVSAAARAFLDPVPQGSYLALQFDGQLTPATNGLYATNAIITLGKNLDGSVTTNDNGTFRMDTSFSWTVPLSATNPVTRLTNIFVGRVPYSFAYSVQLQGPTNFIGHGCLTNYDLKF